MTFMHDPARPCDETCDHQARSTPAEALDPDQLGFYDLLDVADAILRKYPPDTIVCSHSVKADRGALTTAAIADLIASCRLRSPESDEAR